MNQKPPPSIDPEILVLLLVAGAITGAIFTAGSYILQKWIEQRGAESRELPEFPPFTKQLPPP